MLATPQRSRIALTKKQKEEIVEWYDTQPNDTTHLEVRNHFNMKWNLTIGRSTITELLNNKEKIREYGSPGSKRARKGNYPELDECLFLWFSNVRAANIPISEAMLAMQCKKFCETLGISKLEFKASHGYFRGFKSRFGIKEYTISGENRGVDPNVVKIGREDIKKCTRKYDLNDVYNFDETALFYRLPPNKTLAIAATSGVKECKERLSIGLCVNASGTDKCKPVVIGKYKRPRCFGKIFDPNYIVHYYNNEKAWMTMIIFKDWLSRFNSKIKLQNRQVLLLVDNAAGHNLDDDFKMSNVEIKYLPPNSTSILQPCDAGIIRSFKCFYKINFLNKCVQNLEHGAAYVSDVKEAIYMIRNAWSLVTSDTIQNCWNHCDILDNRPKADRRSIENEIENRIVGERLHQLDLSQFAFKPSEYVDFEATVSTGEVLSDDEIVNIVKGKAKEDLLDDDSIIIEQIASITSVEAFDAIKILRLFFEQNQKTQLGDYLKSLDSLENNIFQAMLDLSIQPRINSFLKRKLFD